MPDPFLHDNERARIRKGVQDKRTHTAAVNSAKRERVQKAIQRKGVQDRHASYLNGTHRAGRTGHETTRSGSLTLPDELRRRRAVEARDAHA